MYSRGNNQSIKRWQGNSCSQIPPEVICCTKLLLQADAFATILLWCSLSRDSQQSAPGKIKHLAAKNPHVWVSGLIVFGVLKGICPVVSFHTLIWSWTQSILLFFAVLIQGMAVSWTVTATKPPGFQRIFSDKILALVFENSHQKILL